jgi:hypothetical protein
MSPAFLNSPGRAAFPFVRMGAMAGLATGVVARLFMRSISEDHQFTVAGTLLILLTFAGLGAAAGMALRWRRQLSSRRLSVQRGVGLLPLLLMGPFVPLFAPGFLLSLVLAHRGWRRWVRRALVVTACLLGAFLLLVLLSDGVIGPARVVLYAGFAYALFLTNRIVFEPRALAAPAKAAEEDELEVWLSPA